MKPKHMVVVERRGGKYLKILPDGTTCPLETGTSDWARLEAMTDEEIEAAARSDLDAQPLTDAQLKRMRRIPLAKHLRWKLGLSQAEFAKRFHIPLGTLRDWEQHRTEPDQAAQAYLKVIGGGRGVCGARPRFVTPVEGSCAGATSLASSRRFGGGPRRPCPRQPLEAGRPSASCENGRTSRPVWSSGLQSRSHRR
jgi:putative transcriptional regulator